jgi:hypothetical protein
MTIRIAKRTPICSRRDVPFAPHLAEFMNSPLPLAGEAGAAMLRRVRVAYPKRIAVSGATLTPTHSRQRERGNAVRAVLNSGGVHGAH